MAELSGRPDEAVARFQEAIVLEPDRVDARLVAHDKFLPLELRREPFASLRDDARYRRLLAKLNLQ